MPNEPAALRHNRDAQFARENRADFQIGLEWLDRIGQRIACRVLVTPSAGQRMEDLRCAQAIIESARVRVMDEARTADLPF